MSDPVNCLVTNLQHDFTELTNENQKLKDQNSAKRALISEMAGRIKDLEAEGRELEMQNFRLKGRIRVINEHKQETERSRRESSVLLEELYQNAMDKFEQLQVENNKTKLQLRNLMADMSSNSENNAACPMRIDEYEDIVRFYEKASDNFLRTLDRYYKEYNDKKCNRCGKGGINHRSSLPGGCSTGTCPIPTTSPSPAIAAPACATRHKKSFEIVPLLPTAFVVHKEPGRSSTGGGGSCPLNRSKNCGANGCLLAIEAPPDQTSSACPLNASKSLHLERLPKTAFITHQENHCGLPGGTCALNRSEEMPSLEDEEEPSEMALSFSTKSQKMIKAPSMTIPSDISTSGSTPMPRSNVGTHRSRSPVVFYEDPYGPQEGKGGEGQGSCAAQEKNCVEGICELQPRGNSPRDSGRPGCSFWPDRKGTGNNSMISQSKVKTTEGESCQRGDNSCGKESDKFPIEEEEERVSADEDEEQKDKSCGCKNTSKVLFKCNACGNDNKLIVATPTCNYCETAQKLCENNCARIMTGTNSRIAPPRKVLRRQGAVYQDSDEDLLEDMRKADKEQRLQRSAAPEPSAGRLATAGVVSFQPSPKRSQSMDTDSSMSDVNRRDSLPRVIQEKLASVGRFVGDFVRTFTSSSKSSFRVPSVEEIKTPPRTSTPLKSSSRLTVKK